MFRDNTVDTTIAGLAFFEGHHSITDCLITGNVAIAGDTGALALRNGATVSVLRTTFRNNRAGTQDGCFSASGTLTIDDSEISNCWADGKHGIMSVLSFPVTIRNTRMVGNGAAGKGALVHLTSIYSSLRISGSTITDTKSEVGEFAIDSDSTVPDFALQLDTVVTDGSVDIFSHGKVLVQNCKGFNSTAVQNASVAMCQSTSDYCLAESCADKGVVGTDCICDIDGVPNPFPTDCMQSAVIEARLSIESSLIPAACDVFWLPHSGPGTVDTYSHVYHPETSQQDGRVRTIERACFLTVSA